jgi:recombinational DNA repair protein RecR
MSNSEKHDNLEEILNDCKSYLKYCKKCFRIDYHKDEKCLTCDGKRKSEVEVKPHVDRFLANDPIDW